MEQKMIAAKKQPLLIAGDCYGHSALSERIAEVNQQAFDNELNTLLRMLRVWFGR